MPIRERLAPFLLLLPLCACGNPGLPLPPSLKLPEPAADLSADRVADTVRLHWTMSRRSTDRLLLKGDQRAVICRAAESAPCQRIGELLVEAGKPASFQDALPPALTSGEPRLLRYELRLQNRRHQDAGAAASAFAMAGLPPPAVAASVGHHVGCGYCRALGGYEAGIFRGKVVRRRTGCSPTGAARAGTGAAGGPERGTGQGRDRGRCSAGADPDA